MVCARKNDIHRLFFQYTGREIFSTTLGFLFVSLLVYNSSLIVSFSGKNFLYQFSKSFRVVIIFVDKIFGICYPCFSHNYVTPVS